MTIGPRLLIVGGGMTGLSAAYIAACAGRQVTLIDATTSPGGLLETFPVGGTNLEKFYHHFFTHDSALHWLIKELGLESKLRFLDSSMGIYRDSRIHSFNSPWDLLRFSPISFVSRLRFALTSLYLSNIVDWYNWEDVPCLQWLRRFAGRSATEAIWQPMLAIKFGPYADRLPASWLIGRLRQRVHSRGHEGERLGYIDGSLSILLVTLLARLKSLGVQIVTEQPVLSLLVNQNTVVGVRTSSQTYTADHTLVTIPVDRYADLVNDLDPAYATKLRQIEHFGAVCTVLEMDRPLGSHYWLNVADPGFPFGGVIEHTQLVSSNAYSGLHIAYLSRYYERTNKLSTMPAPEIADMMLSYLPSIFPKYDRSHILKTHVFRTNSAAFVCGPNFSRKVPSLAPIIPGISYAGMVHVYPDERSCNNSICVAANSLAALGIDTSHVPVGLLLTNNNF